MSVVDEAARGRADGRRPRRGAGQVEDANRLELADADCGRGRVEARIIAGQRERQVKPVRRDDERASPHVVDRLGVEYRLE